MARACGSYPQCRWFDPTRRYQFDTGSERWDSILRPTSCILWPIGQVVKTSPFHGGNGGSSPPWVTSRDEVGNQSHFVSSFGSIAQLGEHLPYKQGVIGSSPIVPTTGLTAD